MTGALNNIKVLEFGHYIAGPLLGMFLADQGADVIKIERPPSGDPMRKHPGFQVWNRGKRSAMLDLKNDHDLKIVRKLAQGVDVVIENFRPGVMERLGLGYESLFVDNPGLIYVSMPGFGAASPYRQIRGWETLVGASTATYSGLNAPDTGGPVYTILPISSMYAAVLSSSAVAAALFHRMRYGEGQRIETPLHNATFLAAGYYLVKVPGKGPAQFEKGGHGGPQPAIRTAGIFKCKDGRFISAVGAAEFLPRLLQAFGHPEHREIIQTLISNRERTQEAQDWNEWIETQFTTKTASEWETILGSLGVPMSMTRTIDEWIADPHAIDSGAVVSIEDSVYGLMKQVGIQVRLSATPGFIKGSAPKLGEHTQTIMQSV